ncbi:sulfite dehydrogenase [Endozoicomonas sp.]|uniref:sulfite dehydrogenase n=1 Tax=Endozoicomonas sp. TaxID=1892382 RepID=UPI002886D99F|nr:sulfite dehydrogenase [Endozoicomonas sp.]
MNKEKKRLSIARRQFLKSATLSALSTLAMAGSVVAGSPRYPGPLAGTKGTRSRYEELEKYVRGVLDIDADTPIHRLYGMLTPSDMHFQRNHSGIPEINPDDYQLLIHGLVDKNLKFTLPELKRFPSVSRIAFLECSGNCRDYFIKGPQTTPQHLAGLTSQSEWTGVSLATLLREAGLKPKARWVLAEGGDAALMTRSIPIAKAMDDAIICYAQNGEAVRPEQGYPVRLLLPGWEGSCSVKWLRRLKVGDQPWMTREETARYTDPLSDNTARQFSFVMDARSIITSPTYPMLMEKGWHEIRGLAWSGRGAIKSVEVSVDGGGHWQSAHLNPPVLAKAHTRFTLPWHWNGKETLLLSRTTDDTGYVQPSARILINARGIGSLRYHNNAIIGWRIHQDGRVTYDVIA